ncbi:hypothetical protein [Paenibacillus sp. YYML68]|uniref:hypothetical protein n=1 Tax=Paenibacillus sp. YYML68 TaxID=2909250 RepID=UPI002491E07B|nr:hypothetical protein [Paenibacillus sp. YYML68]
MKRSKKSLTVLSFTIGACLFVSTAFADALLGSGYDKLKQAIKDTAGQMESGMENYTVETVVILKSSEQVLMQSVNQMKVDQAKKAKEELSQTQQAGGNTHSRFSYRDPKLSIWKNDSGDHYFVSENTRPSSQFNVTPFGNPFKEKGAPEIEKIVDAFVGSLKEYVQAEETVDGGISYGGSLSEAQVPALVNAVASYGMKRMVEGQSHGQGGMTLPSVESDIYVSRVSGSAHENKVGVLESLHGDITLTGRDESGVQHDLTMSIMFKLTNIGSTKVEVPDLTGKDIQRIEETYNGLSNKHVGVYTNPIVLEQEGRFVKIGERRLELTTVTHDRIKGTFAELIKPGFESQYLEPVSFAFDSNPSELDHGHSFVYTNAKGEQEFGQLHDGGFGKLYMNIARMHNYKAGVGSSFDGQFHRVFEE